MSEGSAPDGPCRAPEHRQFDFWIGEWEVRDPDGTLAGHNTITPLFDGCALREEWRGESGMLGTSLNAWARRSRTWHQTWVDSMGSVLRLEGGLRDGAMVMEGEVPGLDGEPATRHRISWSPTGDGGVRQHWQATKDGKTWETVFDGRYRAIR